MTAETLRKIVELCGPIPIPAGAAVGANEADGFYLMWADHIIAHARRVLRDTRGVDVCFSTSRSPQWFACTADCRTELAAGPTEPDAILAALEATIPVEPKERYTLILHPYESWYVISEDGVAQTAAQAIALLNAAPAPVDIDAIRREARAEAFEEAACLVIQNQPPGSTLHRPLLEQAAAERSKT